MLKITGFVQTGGDQFNVFIFCMFYGAIELVLEKDLISTKTMFILLACLFCVGVTLLTHIFVVM